MILDFGSRAHKLLVQLRVGGGNDLELEPLMYIALNTLEALSCVCLQAGPSVSFNLVQCLVAENEGSLLYLLQSMY